MRPHAPSARTKAAGLARARMLMKAKLGWLEGHPCASATPRASDGPEPAGWIVVPEDERPVERIVLGRDHLRRATYAASKLRGEFPRALPKLVGDVDAWHAAVTAVIAALKPWVHHGQPPAADLFESEIHSRTARARARALRRAHPGLCGLVDAVSWVLATRAAAAPKALAWIEREAAALEVIREHVEPDVADPLVLQLVHLALALGPKPLAPLVRLLGEPAAHVAPLQGAEHAKQARAAIEPPRRALPPEPRAQLPAALAEAAGWLVAQDPATAKRWLALLERCDLAPLTAAWAQWWPTARKLAATGHAVLGHEDDGPRRKQRLTRIRRQLAAHREVMPPELAAGRLLAALRPLAEPGFEPMHATACRVLGRFVGPEHTVARAGLSLGWSSLHATTDPWWIPGRLPLLLRALDEHLRAGPPARLAPWISDARKHAAQGHGGHGIDVALLESTLEAADITRFFQALRRLEADTPSIDPGDVWRTLLYLLQALHDAELAARLVGELHRAGHLGWISPVTLRVAWRICAPDAASYVAVVRTLERIENETGLSPRSLVDGMAAAPGRDPLPLLRALLQDDDLGPLVRCGRKLAVLHAQGKPLPAAGSSAAATHAWISSYPATLHDDLAWLCDQTEQAEAIAARVLRSIHHDAAAIDDERRAIEGMLPHATPERQAALQSRLVTLARRRQAPAPTPSPVKLERLRAKLRRRGALARLEALEAAADATLPGVIAKDLGLPSPQPWMLEERVLALLVPFRELTVSIRQLARLVFQARAGDPPWDLRDHPANATFLAMLRARGLDPAPWLDGIGTIETGKGEHTMRLSLEDDPLEVLHMGRWFGTCLSPGQCNFFSVFANAADVNKRVLYARDARGKVLGRRLFCLTEAGALLAFHAYCHDAGSGFAEASADFARRLAAAMGTVIVGRGTVPRLLAPDWYDDGPVDITGQFDVLSDDSSFRQALLRATPLELPALLTQAFGRPKLDEVLAPMVIALPELGGRPDLARTLLGLVRHPERLPLAACQQLAGQLTYVGEATEAAAVLAEPMAAALLQQHRQHQWMAFDALDELARLAPSRALELLRRTRDRGVRSWEAESQMERLLAAGAAMQALRRPAQALRLYRLAHAAYGQDWNRAIARERIALLDPDGEPGT